MSMGLLMVDPNAPTPPLISNPEENEGPRIFGAVTATTSLALATVITRFYVRSIMIRNFGWDVSWQRDFLSLKADIPRSTD